MAYGEDAACGFDFSAVDNQCSVVEGRILEKYVFNQARVDCGIDYVAAFFVVVERHILLDDDECAGFAFRHVHASIYDWYDTGMQVFCIVFMAVMKQAGEEFPSFFRAEFDQEPFDLILEDYDKNQQADAHYFVENRAYELHFEDFCGDHPYEDECEHSVEDVDGA